MSKINKGNKTKPKLQKGFCAQVFSLQWAKHQLSKLEITKYFRKSKVRRSEQTKPTSDHYPSYMNIETWKIYLPVFILSDNVQGCCIE